MKVRITDPARLSDLVEFLEEQGVLVTRLGPDELEAGLIGSYNMDAMRMQLELRVRAWETARQARGEDVSVEVGDEPSAPATAAGLSVASQITPSKRRPSLWGTQLSVRLQIGRFHRPDE